MTDDTPDSVKKAMIDLRMKMMDVQEKIAKAKAQARIAQERIIADGSASARRRSTPTLSQRDRRFLKSIRIVAW